MNPEGGKISTQIMTTWRITDKTAPHLELVTAGSKCVSLNTRADCVYCARNAVIGSTFVARSAGT